MINIYSRLRTAVMTLVLATGALSAAALDVTVVNPGSLAETIGDRVNETSLKVIGPVDASDLYYIGREMTALTDLDLSGAEIRAYSGRSLEGRTMYGEGVLPGAVFGGLPLSRFVYPSKGEIAVGAGAFAGTRLSGAVLPSNVTSVGDGAFAGCGELTSVTMPACVLGAGVFAGCTSLSKVNLNGTKTVPAQTFKGCQALTEVIGSAVVETIGDRAFEGCRALTEFTFGRTLSTVGEGAFGDSGLKSADMSGCKALARLGDGAFANCQALESVRLPWVLEETGTATFLGDKGVTALLIPDGVAEVGSHSLAATGLKDKGLILCDGLEKIGDYALAGADGLTEIVLPATLESIGTGAMQDMTALNHINGVGPEHPARLGSDVWRGVDQKNVTLLVDESRVEEYSNAEQWKEFKIEGKSGVDDIESDQPGAVSVTATTDGTMLTVVSSGAEIARLRVYDTDGRLIAASTPGSTEATVNIAAASGNILIVSADLTDSTSFVTKLTK